jgi:hypothetical protein
MKDVPFPFFFSVLKHVYNRRVNAVGPVRQFYYFS